MSRSGRSLLHRLRKYHNHSLFSQTVKYEFHADWYREQYLRGQSADPLGHYLTIGLKAGNSPNRFFDETFYLSAYADVREAVEDGTLCCGFQHYLISGRLEGRLPRYDLTKMLDLKMPGVTSPVLLKAVDEIEKAVKPISAIREKSKRRTLWFLLPTLNPDIVFGGYTCVLQLIRNLVIRGNNVKIISTRSFSDREYFLYRYRNNYMADALKSIEIVNAQALKGPIRVGEDDRFFAYSAWDAHLARHLTGLTNQSKFVFLVQEYEPVFHDHGHTHALVAQAYDFPHVPVFNSSCLRNFFEEFKIGIFSREETTRELQKFIVIDHVLTSLPSPSRGGIVKALEIPKLVVYARPEAHASRNLFPIAILGLKRAIERGILSGPWEIIGIGSLGSEKVIPLSGQYELYLKPRLDPQSYASFLEGTSVGLSLIYSPHPGLVSFELAKVGARVVSNTFMNRNNEYLRKISENIVPCPPTIDGVIEGLEEAINSMNDVESRLRGAAQVGGPASWADVFNDKFFRTLDECLA
jgi:hypothetical protein